jgi:hypothetical protein
MPPSIAEQALPEFTELEYEFALARAARSRQQATPVPARDDRATPETIPPERLRLASANITHLSAIIRQLVELRSEEETDEYGTLRPSRLAFETACSLLTDAAIVAALRNRRIPHGCASTDSEGGIRVEWVRPTSSVHLVIPASADRDGYVYHEVGNVYGSAPATPEMLAHWLQEIG